LKKITIPYIYIVFCLFCVSNFFGQELHLKIKVTNVSNKKILNNLSYIRKHQTEKSLYAEINKIKSEFILMGFINTEIISVNKKANTYYALFRLEKKLNHLTVYTTTKFPKEILKEFSLKLTDSTFTILPSKIPQLFKSTLSYYERKGFPFAKIYLENISVTKNTAQLVFQKREQRHITNVKIEGITKFPPSFIKYKLGIKKNNLLTKNKLEFITKQLQTIPFISIIKPPEILFTKDSTQLYLFLKKRKANRFDGLIGFTSKQNSKGIQLNGYLNLEIQNLFNNGEHLKLNWKNNGQNRQSFYTVLTKPYIFKTPITPSFNFSLYRQDSTFLNVSSSLKINYQISNLSTISALYKYENSTNLLQNKTIQPQIKSYKKNQYGIGYNFTLPNLQNSPITKFSISIASFFGSKKQDSITQKQTEFLLTSHYLWKLNSKNEIYLKNKSAILNSPNLAINEFFRIGGTNSIRGFDEESILASSFSTFTVEYRYHTTKFNYIYTVTDAAYIYNQLAKISSNLYGLGLGYAFVTKNGLLNMSYVLGKSPATPFNFNNAKIHINFVTFF